MDDKMTEEKKSNLNIIILQMNHVLEFNYIINS